MSEVKIQFSAEGSQAEQVAERVSKGIDALGKSAEEAAAKNKKGAKLAADSYRKLELELAASRKELKALSLGSEEFNQQGQKVKQLADKLDDAKVSLSKFNSEKAEVKEVTGSISAMELKLVAANAELKKLPVGTEEFKKQGAVVKKLATEYEEAKATMKAFNAATKKIGEVKKDSLESANSVAALRKKFQEARQEMERLDVGTEEFKKQGAAVKKLAKELDVAEKNLKDFAEGKTKVREVSGSLSAMERELTEANNELKKLKIGTAEFAKQKVKVDQLRGSVSQAKQSLSGMESPVQKTNSALSKGKGIVSGSLGNIGQMAAGYLGVQMAIQAVNHELEKKNRLDKEAAGETRTLEQAVAANLPNLAPEDRGEFKETVRDESKRLGVDQTDYANTAGIAISAGAGDLDRAKEILAELFTVTAGDAEQAQALGGAALDFTTLAGNDDIEGAIGQLAATQQKVRSTDMALFAKNIAPAIAGATSGGKNVDGISVERGLELGAVISQLLKDTSGERSATALNQFVSKIDSFEATVGSGELGSVDETTVEKFTATRDFDARLQMLQADEALADQFVDGLKEGKLKNALRELTIGTDRAKTLDAETSAAIPSMADGRANFDDLKKSVIDNTAVLGADRRASANAQFASTDEVVALRGEIAKIFDETMSDVDLVGLDLLNLRGRNNSIEATRANGGDVSRKRIEIMAQEMSAASGKDLALLTEQRQVMLGLLEKLDQVKLTRRTGVTAEQIAAFDAENAKRAIVDPAIGLTAEKNETQVLLPDQINGFEALGEIEKRGADVGVGVGEIQGQFFPESTPKKDRAEVEKPAKPIEEQSVKTAAIEQARHDETKAVMGALVARLDTLIGTNQQGFNAAIPPDVQHVRMQPGDPTELPSAGAVA